MRTKRGATHMQGCCHDCSQGLLISPTEGFEYWNEDGDGRGIWFCRYCGSNHCTLTLDDGASGQSPTNPYFLVLGRDLLDNTFKYSSAARLSSS